MSIEKKDRISFAAVEAEESRDIHIDTATIPAHIRDNLAASTLDLLHDILR